MKLGKRIPVEPLDEERLTNIERRLVVAVSTARPDAQRRAGRSRSSTRCSRPASSCVLGWTWHRCARRSAGNGRCRERARAGSSTSR